MRCDLSNYIIDNMQDSFLKHDDIKFDRKFFEDIHVHGLDLLYFMFPFFFKKKERCVHGLDVSMQ